MHIKKGANSTGEILYFYFMNLLVWTLLWWTGLWRFINKAKFNWKRIYINNTDLLFFSNYVLLERNKIFFLSSGEFCAVEK